MTHDHDHPHDHDHDHAHPHAHSHPEVDPNHVEFIGGRPILRVANVAASLEYYKKQLGFEVGFEWSESRGFEGGAPPTHAEVRRGHVVLQFSQSQGTPGAWMYLDLESRAELDKLHAEYAASGARIVEPPSDKPWGMVEMRVEDLDGNVFRVGAPQGFERA